MCHSCLHCHTFGMFIASFGGIFGRCLFRFMSRESSWEFYFEKRLRICQIVKIVLRWNYEVTWKMVLNYFMHNDSNMDELYDTAHPKTLTHYKYRGLLLKWSLSDLLSTYKEIFGYSIVPNSQLKREWGKHWYLFGSKPCARCCLAGQRRTLMRGSLCSWPKCVGCLPSALDDVRRYLWRRPSSCWGRRK